MQVQCTFEREQVCAVVMHTTALNQWGKNENQLTVCNLLIESTSYSIPNLANYKLINLALQIHILAKGIMQGLMVLE